MQGELVSERQAMSDELTHARSKAAAESEYRKRAEVRHIPICSNHQHPRTP